MSIDPTTLRFFETLNADASMQKELEAALEGTKDRNATIVEWAAARGYKFSRSSLESAQGMLAAALHDQGALEDSELEAVAGGLNPQPEPPSMMFKYSQTIQPAARKLLLG